DAGLRPAFSVFTCYLENRTVPPPALRGTAHRHRRPGVPGETGRKPMSVRTILAAAILAAGTIATTAPAEEIKFGIGIPEGDYPEYNALVRFKEYVEFKTNGEITVRLFP